jgi:calcium-dependent protein kinase
MHIQAKNEFDLRDFMNQIIIKKENFVFERSGDISEDYDIHPKILGEGTFGYVRKATEKETKQIRAIKTIPKYKIKNYSRFVNEVYSLKTLDHPNIIKIFEFYESDEEVHLIMEYCSGGELFEYLLNQKVLNERKTAKLFEQIVRAVFYCHKNAICHRDLKPENFIFDSEDENANLKLIDFGLACSYFRLNENGIGAYHRMKSQVGTAYFMAPEVIREDYSSA